MMAGPSNDKFSRSEVCSDDPPPLSITLKKARDLPNETKHWSEVDRPVDILLLTVEDCELLACYHYLKDSFSSYEKSIGYVYFGKMSEDKYGSLKVALMRCSKQSLYPGGSQTTTKNAVTLLKPKATFLVGFCYSLNPDKAQLGDVVISSKLTTDFHKTPVSSYIGNLVRSAAYGWKAPLEYPETREVNVCDGEILSCSDLIDAKQQCQSYPGAIAAEIEGKGLFAAAHEMKMEWLVVKGVCAFVHGVASTNESWKTFACVMAASVVSYMLRNSLVFEDWPHYRGDELDIKVEVDNMKLKEQNTQTGMLATESDRYQEVQQPRASAPSAASESVSCPQTEDLKARGEEIFQSIVRNYLQTTPPQSSEERNKFKEYLKAMRLIITGVSLGCLLITVKCESLMILEKLWTDYSSGHLGEVVQNCFVTEKILKELNLAELRLKTTMDIEEYNACKMLFEKDALRGALSSEFHSTSSTSESPQITEQWGKREQKTTFMERAKLGDTTPHTVVPTTGHGRELEESRGRTDTVPLLVSPTSDPEEELGELRMELPRMKDISAEEESCKSDDPSENKRRRLADILTGEEGCKSGDPSENKRRRLAEPLNVEKCQEKLKSYYDTFSKVKIVPWDESSSIEFNKIYTPLSWVRDHREPSGVTEEELEDYTDMFKERRKRMLVYGRPGIGKSTFCKKAAYDWSKALKGILKNFSILLLIKLRDVCDVGNIRDVLRVSKLLASDGLISVDSLYDYIVKNQDKVLLILDGYEEYSCRKEHSPILAIWKGEQLRDCHVIVTMQQLKYDELRGPSHVQFEIHGFKSWEQKRIFARKFLADEQDLDEFMSYLEEKDLVDMAEIPLLLQMLCILWKEKHHKGLPKSIADVITQFIQTMLNHKGGSHQPLLFQKVTSTEDLSNLGKVAFEALLQDHLYVRRSELPGNISRGFQKLSEVGLFQIVNLTSLNPEKGAYFIHKSVQEFLAAWHIKEEVLSIKGESTPSLSKVESFEKIVKMNEVLKFACELSTEAACAVFHHVGSVGRKEFLSKCDYSELLLENEILSQNQKNYLKLISHSYICCSAEKRQDLCSVFPSCTGGVLSLDSNQLNITANEHFLKSGMIPDFIFFPLFKDSSEKSYRDLITVAEDTNAVFLSCSGEKKAADLLKKFPRRPVGEFFLKRETKIVVYVYQIRKEKAGSTFPTEMLRELTSPTAESTQVTRLVDPLNEHDSETASSLTQNTDRITSPTPESLSCVKHIYIVDIERQEIKMLADFLTLFTALRWLGIFGKPSEVIDAQLTETLVSRIIFTDRFHTLVLTNINLTAKPAAAIARSLHQAPSLRHLNLSENPLGEGVSVLTQHLSRVPHLERLWLSKVKMTKQQVNELSATVRQSNIYWLKTEYHDEEGNVKPEEEWPTDEYWEDHWSELEEESNPGSVTDSGDEQMNKQSTVG